MCGGSGGGKQHRAAGTCVIIVGNETVYLTAVAYPAKAGAGFGLASFAVSQGVSGLYCSPRSMKTAPAFQTV